MLFEFESSVGTWYFSSTDDEPLAGYDATYIKCDDDFVLSDEIGPTEIKIKTSADNSFAQKFYIQPPDSVIYVKVRMYQKEPTEETYTLWSGGVTEVSFSGIEATITCSSRLLSQYRMGLRKKYSRHCDYKLYGAGCEVNESEWTRNIVIISVSGNEITTLGMGVLGIEEGSLKGGKATLIKTGAETERRHIISNTQFKIETMTQFRDAEPGDILAVTFGCAHTYSACKGFNNELNFGGMPFIPEDDGVFRGDPL
jgi:uncharacterized phage protein (TIGR02218 family)